MANDGFSHGEETDRIAVGTDYSWCEGDEYFYLWECSFEISHFSLRWVSLELFASGVSSTVIKRDHSICHILFSPLSKLSDTVSR